MEAPGIVAHHVTWTKIDEFQKIGSNEYAAVEIIDSEGDRALGRVINSRIAARITLQIPKIGFA